MSSQIAPATINPQFPYAGIDNNTQGFRDNFAGTQNNFSNAANEINDLINKCVVTAPLIRGNASVSNNLNGLPLSGALLSSFSYATTDHGTLTSSTVEPFDFKQGYIHTVTINGNPATTTVNPANAPTVGFGPLNIQVTVQNTNHNISLASLTNVTPFQVPGYDANTKIINFNAIGTYFFTLSTQDSITWVLTSQNDSSMAESYTPSTSIGVLGDTAGMVAYDASYIYVCSGNYDGVSHIWRRAAATSW